MAEDAPPPRARILPRAPVALLLDFDGVVVESVELKVQAFLTVYAGEDPAKLADVLTYQQHHGGVTRRVKFQHFERSLFGRTGDAESVERLSATYTALVHDAVLACPFVPGAHAFLEAVHDRTDLHVISGTPQEELVDIVERRGLARYFRSVVGAPATKPAAFARILADYRYPPARTLAVGDATTEYDAACGLGIPFLAIVAPGHANRFPDDVPVAASLEHLDARLGLSSPAPLRRP